MHQKAALPRENRFYVCSNIGYTFLSCIQQSHDPISETARKDFAKHTQAFITEPNRIDRLHMFLQGKLCDVCSGDLGRHALLLVFFHTGNASGDSAAVNIISDNILLPCCRETGTNISRLSAGNGNSKRSDFIGKRTGIGFDRRLGCGIKGLERNMCHCRNRTDIDNPATAITTHIGQYGLIHIHHTEKVYIKLPLGIRKLCKLHSSGNSKTCTVYQNIDSCLLCGYLTDRILYSFLVRYIHTNMMDSVMGKFLATEFINRAARIP